MLTRQAKTVPNIRLRDAMTLPEGSSGEAAEQAAADAVRSPTDRLWLL
jgi:hypothetical protein